MPAVSGGHIHTVGGQTITRPRKGRGTTVSAPPGVPASKPAGGTVVRQSGRPGAGVVQTITRSPSGTVSYGPTHAPSPGLSRSQVRQQDAKARAAQQAANRRAALVTQAQHNLAKLAKPKIIHQLNKAGTINPHEVKALKAAAPHVVLHYGNRFNPDIVHNVLSSIAPKLPNLPQNQKPKAPQIPSQLLKRGSVKGKAENYGQWLREHPKATTAQAERFLRHQPAARRVKKMLAKAKLAPGGQKPKKHSRYVNPYKHSQQAIQTRTDAGVDYTGKGDIGAIGKAKILSTTSGFGGSYGTQGVLYKLLAGPKKGKIVYDYENIVPTVQAGQIVKPGQKVGEFAATQTSGTEMGFANRAGQPLAFAKGTALPDSAVQGGHYSPQGYNFLKFASRLGAAQTPPPKSAAPSDPRLDPHVDVAGKGKPIRVSGGGPVASKPTKILKAPVSSVLSKSQQIFAAVLAKQTGLDPRVTGAWLHGEEPAATVNPATGNHNWLNIGPGDTGPQYSDPIKGAKYTANLVNTSSNYAGIRASVGQSLASQLAAIVASPWGTKDLSATSANGFKTKKINVNVPIGGPPAGSAVPAGTAAPVSTGASTAPAAASSALTPKGRTTGQRRGLTPRQRAQQQALALQQRRRRQVLQGAISALGKAPAKAPSVPLTSSSYSTAAKTKAIDTGLT